MFPEQQVDGLSESIATDGASDGLDWWLDWSDKPCVIVASGPSAKTFKPKDVPKGCKVIAINSSWALAPKADVLYACDRNWWRLNIGHVRHLSALKVSGSPDDMREFPDVKRVTLQKRSGQYARDLIYQPRGILAAGFSSGFQALNLAIQFGAKNILLVGYDSNVRDGKHWHDDHVLPLRNPFPGLCDRWRDVHDGQAAELKRRGVSVTVRGPTALTAYPIVGSVKEWASARP